MPPGVDGMSGQTITGFAHGVAGIVYFLAEYSRRFEGPAVNAWRAGGEWLIGEARPTANGEGPSVELCHGRRGTVVLVVSRRSRHLADIPAAL